MKKLITLTCAIFMLCIVPRLYGQQINCQSAVYQLQSYATQVNQMYSYEYWNAIPNIRCPAVDGWGRAFPPQQVYQCRQMMLGRLNNWYMEQSNYVNYSYQQIVSTCFSAPHPTINPAPLGGGGTEQISTIDTEEIEDLVVGIDEEKAVRISIPTTPNGFQP